MSNQTLRYVAYLFVHSFAILSCSPLFVRYWNEWIIIYVHSINIIILMHVPVEQCFQPKDHLGYSQLATNRCSIEPVNSCHMIISPWSVKHYQLPLILWEQDSSCPWEYQGRWLLGSWRCSGRCGCGRSPWAAWRGTRGWSGCRGSRCSIMTLHVGCEIAAIRERFRALTT